MRFVPLALPLLVACATTGDAPSPGSSPPPSALPGDVLPAPEPPLDPGAVPKPRVPQPILTQRYDTMRTGANVHENVLSPATVVPGRFGLLFSRPVVGQIYAQPLYLPGFPIAGGTHDVVFVATEHNEVYAFDASEPAASDPLWHVSLGTPVPQPDVIDTGIRVEIGITSTPVIDLELGTIFVVTHNKENGSYLQRLHALALADGAERPGSPVALAPDAPSTASDATSGRLTLNGLTALQRVALTETNGTVVVAEGSHGDLDPFHGWVLAYDAATLAPLGAHLVTPSGSGGGIWQAGQGLAVDERGDVFYLSGNGSYDGTKSPPDLGDSFVKLHVGAGGIAIADWFTPFNEADLDNGDLDLGSAGALVVPGTGLVLGGGKEGKLYVVDHDAMGGHGATADAIVQSLQATRHAALSAPDTGYLHSTPVFWNDTLYVSGEDDCIYAYRFRGRRFDDAPFARTASELFDAILSLSADGDGGAILWANTPTTTTNDGALTAAGTLRAYDATSLHELWNSDVDPRDAVGGYAKFSVPAVADGKVFLATSTGALRVYGVRKGR
jgi:hypothetical protein